MTSIALVLIVPTMLAIDSKQLAWVFVGYVVIRLDLFLTGPRGRRARQDEAALARNLVRQLSVFATGAPLTASV